MLVVVALWVDFLRSGAEREPKDLLVAGGASLFLLGVLYKLLGRWDLIPDWIPVFGSIDDAMAWILVLVGAAMGYVGWYVL